MLLGYIIIYVSDVTKTVDFYKQAFGLNLRFAHESNQYAEMDTGQTVLAFSHEDFAMASHPFRPNRKNEQPAGAEIVFVVEDVEAAFQQAIDSGATKIHTPSHKPWGQIVSYVRDNNGFIIEICNAIQEL